MLLGYYVLWQRQANALAEKVTILSRDSLLFQRRQVRHYFSNSMSVRLAWGSVRQWQCVSVAALLLELELGVILNIYLPICIYIKVTCDQRVLLCVGLVTSFKIEKNQPFLSKTQVSQKNLSLNILQTNLHCFELIFTKPGPSLTDTNNMFNTRLNKPPFQRKVNFIIRNFLNYNFRVNMPLFQREVFFYYWKLSEL